jgi:IclR family KDG regulon transcriptional repressor
MTEGHNGTQNNRVRSIEKALRILEVLNQDYELSLGEISEKLGMDKGTTHRLIGTLKHAGYIDQNPHNRKYANSIKLFEMGNHAVDKKGLRKTAEPFIEEAAHLAGETINLGVLYENHVIYIDKIESHETIKVGLNIGKRIPVYCTGLGKTILAFSSAKAVDAILREITYEAFTQNTVKNRETLKKQLEDIKKQGFCIDDEEYVEGLVCIAAPIFDHSGEPVAAVSISVPKYRYIESCKQKDFTKIVTATAVKISQSLGFR